MIFRHVKPIDLKLPRYTYCSIAYSTTTHTTPQSTTSSENELVPLANVKWYYATDVPLTKPSWFDYSKSQDAKKFIPFSDYDSQRIETKLKKYLESHQSPLASVSEDQLFEVNVETLTLTPIYWEGPVYEVRRGLWFNSGDGLPLTLDLTKAIETGYRNKKPYLFDKDRKSRTTNLTKTEIKKLFETKEKEEFVDDDDLILLDNDQAVLYFDDDKALLFPQSMVNSYQLRVLRGWGPGNVPIHNVIKLQRGYNAELDSSLFKLPNNPIPGLANILQEEVNNFLTDSSQTKESTGKQQQQEQEQEQAMKHVIEDDFENFTNKDTSNREVDHLIFCIHGIGQILGTAYESINFPHSINILRNTMKAVYRDNDDFKKMAYSEETNELKFNNRIQVLPISWRHKIDFQPSKLLPNEDVDNPRLPTLDQVTVDKIKSLRNVVGSVALDILLYYEGKYFKQILECVTSELNRVYKLYMEKNPQFNGKIHILGHSLGSAIAFDITASQLNHLPETPDLRTDVLFDIDSLFCVGSPLGVFKLLNEKNIVSRKTLPESYNPRDSSITFSSPKCENLYNLYHPCDPIGYRIEPLIKPRFSRFKPEEVPFAIEGLLSQIKGITAFTDELQDRIAKVTSWVLKARKNAKIAEGINDKFINENALGEIVKSIVKSEDDNEQVSKGKLSPKDFEILQGFNKHVRVDYALPMGVFDISLISAISAHVSYFEDQDTAGFIISKLLTNPSIESKTVLYENNIN